MTVSEHDYHNVIALLTESLHFVSHKHYCDVAKNVLNARCSCGLVGFMASVKRFTA